MWGKISEEKLKPSNLDLVTDVTPQNLCPTSRGNKKYSGPNSPPNIKAPVESNIIPKFWHNWERKIFGKGKFTPKKGGLLKTFLSNPKINPRKLKRRENQFSPK